MRKSHGTLALIALCFLPLTLSAQEPAADEAMEEGEIGCDLNMGREVDEEDVLGEFYVRETHGDWEIRCVRSEGEADPCRMLQNLEGEDGNAVFSMFSLPDGGRAVAGASIAVPLMTLLTEQLGISVDGGVPKRYEFSWCDPEGCYARVGFTQEDIDAFKSGATATVSLVWAVDPDRRILVPMSLTGFTSAFDSLNGS